MVDESSLLQAASGGDERAIGQIFDLYASMLFRYAFHLCHDRAQADRVVGDVFAKLMEHLSRGAGPRTNLRAYLYQITYHVVVEEARRTRRICSMDLVANVSDGALPVSMQVEQRELKRAVFHFMQHGLTDEQRNILILRFVEGFSLKETAHLTGKTENALSVVQNRALGKIRKALQVKFSIPGQLNRRAEMSPSPA